MALTIRFSFINVKHHLCILLTFFLDSLYNSSFLLIYLFCFCQFFTITFFPTHSDSRISCFFLESGFRLSSKKAQGSICVSELLFPRATSHTGISGRKTASLLLARLSPVGIRRRLYRGIPHNQSGRNFLYLRYGFSVDQFRGGIRQGFSKVFVVIADTGQSRHYCIHQKCVVKADNRHILRNPESPLLDRAHDPTALKSLIAITAVGMVRFISNRRFIH